MHPPSRTCVLLFVLLITGILILYINSSTATTTKMEFVVPLAMEDDGLSFQHVPSIITENISDALSLASDSSTPSSSLAFPVHHRKEWKYVYFQHVRKSGGTAFNELLLSNKLNNYGNNPTHRVIFEHDRGINESFRVIKQRMIDYDVHLVRVEYIQFFVMEYLKYHQKGELFGDVLLITLFRHPLKRIFSDLPYHGTWVCNNWRKFGNWSRTDPERLEQALIQCLHHNQGRYTSNVYTKIFSAVWPGAIPDNILERRGVDFNSNVTIRRIHLELAKLILSEFDIVIILEQWEETKVQLKCNGLQNDTLLHLNEGGEKKEMDMTLDDMPMLKEEMIRLNQYDLELYDFAKELAMERVQSCTEMATEQDS